MTFAKKVQRLKGKASSSDTIKRELEDEIEDPAALAANHIEMHSKWVHGYNIGRPRASSIHKACIRMHVIGTVKKLGKQEITTVRTRLLWGYGNAYHWWVQNTPDVFGLRRLGWWKCYACGKVLYFGYPPKQECKFCGASPRAAFYHEHSLKLESPFPVSGHPDLFLDVHKLIRVVEAKTMNGADFVKLVAPLADHEFQCQTYMWGCARDKNLPVKIDPEVGYILYISKKSIRSALPFKMFKVRKNASILKQIKAKCRSYRVGVEDYPKSLPDPHDECLRNEFRNYMAKHCVSRKECLRYA